MAKIMNYGKNLCPNVPEGCHKLFHVCHAVLVFCFFCIIVLLLFVFVFVPQCDLLCLCGLPWIVANVGSRSQAPRSTAAELPRNSRSGSETAGGAAPTTCRSDLQQMLLDVLLHVRLCPRQHAACQPADGRLGFWNAGSEQWRGSEILHVPKDASSDFALEFFC